MRYFLERGRELSDCLTFWKRLIFKDQNQMNMEQIIVLLSREVIRWIEFPGRKQSKTPRRNGKVWLHDEEIWSNSEKRRSGYWREVTIRGGFLNSWDLVRTNRRIGAVGFQKIDSFSLSLTLLSPCSCPSFSTFVLWPSMSPDIVELFLEYFVMGSTTL
jgi:hypothetical protein